MRYRNSLLLKVFDFVKEYKIIEIKNHYINKCRNKREIKRICRTFFINELGKSIIHATPLRLFFY